MISLFALTLACGSSDSVQTPTGGTETPPVSASTGQGAPTPPAPSAPEPAARVDPQAESCLQLVGDAKFQQAVPVCMAALRADPSNQQVKDALGRAQAETAKLADAQGAAEAAAGSASEDATSKLGEATGGMNLGQ